MNARSRFALVRSALPLFLLLLLALAAAVHAADNSVTVVLHPGDQPQRLATVVEALRDSGRPLTVRWEDAPATAAATAAVVPAASAAPGLWTSFEAGLAKDLRGLVYLPALLQAIAAAWPGPADTAWLLGLFAVAGIGAWGVHALLRRLSGTRPAPAPDLVERLRASCFVLLIDAAALAAFVLLGRIGLAWLTADAAREAGERLLLGGATAALYLLCGRFLLAPGAPARRLLPLPDPGWHFGMLLAYGVLGSAVGQSVRLAQDLRGDALATEGGFLLGATVLTLLKLVWFWGGRHGISALARGEGMQPPWRCVLAAALPWLLIAFAVLIWMLGCIAAAAPQRAHWGAAAGATQILVLVLPIAAIGADALVGTLIERRTGGRALAPLPAAATTVARTLAGGAVWVFGLYAIARMWNLYLLDPGSSAALAAIGALLRISAALIAAWVAWRFLGAWFDAHAPQPRSLVPGEDEGEVPVQQGRFATVLPLLRHLSRGAILAVGTLVVLSALGIDIGPLLAGFGVLGLALSFGSQALVRDIISGAFFMADDAFRLGEYVDTGRLRGTVERITLRSVQLRHQNGQIHTVPFGQLQAVTNFSRDWATMKFTIRIERDADLEKARKTIKKVGLLMLEDPELGPDFLVPLKLQGIQDITDTAVVLRLKFTSKPTRPTYLQREALKRVYRALQEAGVALASNVVTVRGGEASAAAAAAVPAGPAAALPPL